MIDADAYVELEARFSAIFLSLKTRLSHDAAVNVEAYIAAAELEMACESCVLSLAEESVVVSEECWQGLLRICRALGLDRESVFRPNFLEFVQASVLRKA